jgi:multisubunit Na+/H+ antiporter MnhC subunit
MRALSGAIITAAALIGLGLTAQGIGTRYQRYWAEDENGVPTFGEKSQVKFHELDNPMKVAVVVTIASVVIGLGITFLGLAFHHHRRHHEHLHRLQNPAGITTNPRVTV